jgi:hypothetical protein
MWQRFDQLMIRHGVDTAGGKYPIAATFLPKPAGNLKHVAWPMESVCCEIRCAASTE